MTISTTQNQLSYTGDGVSLAFAFPFPFITPTDLKVFVAGVLQTTGYSISGTVPVSGSGTYASGTVTFVTPPAIGATVYIYCDPDQLQSTSLPPNDPFPSKTVEKMIDKVTLLIQRLTAKFGNALTFPIGDSTSGVLPSAAARANGVLGFDTNGALTIAAVQAGSSITFGQTVIDQFTGDGSTTVFALSQNPGLQTNLLVAIGGVVQRNGTDFTWVSGTTLTFTTAPPNGVGFNARYTHALPMGTSDAASTTYNGATNYAVRTIGHEASVAPSIDSFAGVDATGANDSAAAMTAAIAVASVLGVTTLRFPGIYKVLSQVTLAAGITYLITGTINLNVPEVGLVIPTGTQKITLDGQGTGTIQGISSRAIASPNGGTVGDVRVRGLNVTGATLPGLGYTAGLFLDGATRVWVERCRFYGNGIGVSTVSGNNDVLIFTATNSYVSLQENVCTSTAVGYHLAVYDATECHFGFNKCNGAVAGSSNNNGYAYLLYSAVAGTCQRATFIGNEAANIGGSAIYCADVQVLSLVGNILNDVAKTQSDVSIPVGGISLNGCTDVTAAGNVVKKSGKSGIVSANGVRVSITGGSVSDCANGGVYLRGTGDGTVVQGVVAENNNANLFTDSVAKSDLLIDITSRLSKTGSRGLDLQNVSNSTIRGVSNGNAREGCVITAGAENVVAVTCLNNGTDTANTYDGISSQATKTKFVGCRSGNTAATGQRYGITSTGNYCSVQNCDVTRNQTDGLNLSGTNVQKAGNRVSTTATPGPSQGSAVLVAGTVTVATDEVRTGDLIVLTCTVAGGTQGTPRISTITNATSFAITSSNGADTSTYAWQIVH